MSRFVAATSISRTWAEEALPRLHTHKLHHQVHVSSAAARMRVREMGGETENQRAYLSDLLKGEAAVIWRAGAPELRLPNGEHLGLFAADADQRASTGKTWVARAWRAATTS